MRNFSLTSQKSIVRLRKAYAAGKIPYPRTDNDYHPAEFSRFYAHPPLPPIDDFSVPLKNPSYPLDGNTAILHLSNERIVSAATSVNIAIFLSKFYDDSLSAYPEKREKIREIMSAHRKMIRTMEKEFGGWCVAENGNLDFERVSWSGVASEMLRPGHFFRFPVPKRGRRKSEGEDSLKKRRDEEERWRRKREESRLSSAPRRNEGIDNYPGAEERIIELNSVEEMFEIVLPALAGNRAKQEMIEERLQRKRGGGLNSRGSSKGQQNGLEEAIRKVREIGKK